jgi:proline iminopeptidase
MNNAFFDTDNWLLENISKIRHLPCYIVQGRYDVVCPARSAWDLHKAWPEAKLAIIPDSGHAAGEISTRAALIEATEACKSL